MLIAVYGTLRKGDGNYNHYLNGHEPLGTHHVEGFNLYSLGSYPYVTHGEPTDEVLVEVYDVDLQTVVPIASMEMGAGYDICEVETDYGLAYMFVFGEERHQRLQAGESHHPPKILSGDWFEWLRKYQPERIEAHA